MANWNDIADKALAASVTVIEELPSHPFTPDVVEWAEGEAQMYRGEPVPLHIKAARQILAAVGRG